VYFAAAPPVVYQIVVSNSKRKRESGNRALVAKEARTKDNCKNPVSEPWARVPIVMAAALPLRGSAVTSGARRCSRSDSVERHSALEELPKAEKVFSSVNSTSVQIASRFPRGIRDPMPELSCSDIEVLLKNAVDENTAMEHETRHFRQYMDVHMPKALVREIGKCTWVYMVAMHFIVCSLFLCTTAMTRVAMT
jgi:hypothetical protein